MKNSFKAFWWHLKKLKSTNLLNFSRRKDTVIQVGHHTPISFQSFIWKPIREEFKLIASSHRHFIPKQLCCFSWEFILAVKSIVTDLTQKYHQIPFGFCLEGMGKSNKSNRKTLLFSNPSLFNLPFRNLSLLLSLGVPRISNDALSQPVRHL